MTQFAALILAKFPVAGSVKTRMSPPLSPVEAARLHECCLRSVCENVTHLDALDVKLIVTPDSRAGELAARIGIPSVDAWPQGEGDLGERLSRAASLAFDCGMRGVLLLGADSPTLPGILLSEAIDALAERRVVLGPCDDGGYYLLGFGASAPGLFTGIEWGSRRVADQTRERVAMADIDLCELPSWYDLDHFEDLERARRHLEGADLTARPMARELLECITGLVRRYEDG